MVKKWELLKEMDQTFSKQFAEMHPVTLQLLFNRDLLDYDSMNEFLYPDFEKNLHDPFIFNDMEKSCQRIIKAIQENQKILIYGDYDADGVSSSVVMVSSLELLGGDISIYIPHRELDGYGLSEKTVAHIIEEKFDLVITVDCAISNKDEIATLQQNNIDVILTDHHAEPLELPNAFSIINPQLESENYPFKKLAGVGVAYKLIQGLLTYLQEKEIDLNESSFEDYGGYRGYTKWLLDVVSIGTVADCMPLLNENRVFVKYGLLVLQKTKRLGLNELINHAGINISELQTYHIGYQIAPRINAAGRLDHANVAYELLMSNDKNTVCELSEQLNSTNSDRQDMTEQVLTEARESVKDHHSKNIIFALGDKWSPGIVGLVAGKLVENYNKPVFVLTKAKGNISGSGRSLKAFDMIDALQKHDKYLKAYGGHKMACGFTLKDNNDYDEFVAEMNRYAKDQLKGKDLTPVVKVDTEIDFEDCDWDLLEELKKFEPYGYGNKEPIFMIKNVGVKDWNVIGKTGKHVKLVLEKNGFARKAIAFGFADVWGAQLRTGDKVDIVCNLTINEWNGNREIQLKLVDMKFSV